MNRAVFLDRDGTVIVDKEYLHRPGDVEVFPGVPGALLSLHQAGFLLIIVTNQSGVGRGYFTMADVEAVHAYLLGIFEKAGVKITKIYVAPEAPGQPSHGRKPSCQFLFDAREEFALDLSESFMVGDKLTDVECGLNAGVKRSILVRTGDGAETEVEQPDKLQDVTVVNDFAAAAQYILSV
jgi:D-glycero-D-manno-heptose 1,7-bisphosphate phosphatase